MKQGLILFYVFFIALSTVNAQEKTSKIALGMHTDYFNVPLNKELFVFNTKGVHGVYSFSKKMNIKIAYESNILMDKNLKQYEEYHGAMFELGYFIYNGMSKNFTTELTSSYGTTLNNGFLFENHYLKTGLNFYLFRFFYLGLGLKYLHFEKTNFSDLPVNNFNWYWQMGFQLNF